MLNQEQVKYLEDAHNIVVDAETEMFNNIDSLDSTFGWEPIPAEWFEDAEEGE